MFKYIWALVFCFFFPIYMNALSFESDSSVIKVENNRVYLKPNAIQIANNGIFINEKGSLYSINHLEIDRVGVYFEIDRISKKGEDNWLVKTCPYCGDVKVFGKCWNGECPSNNKN